MSGQCDTDKNSTSVQQKVLKLYIYVFDKSNDKSNDKEKIEADGSMWEKKAHFVIDYSDIPVLCTNLMKQRKNNEWHVGTKP